MTARISLPTVSLRMRIALSILILGTGLLGGILFLSLRHSLDTTRATVAIADHETTALLSDMSRIALLTDEWGALQAFIDALDQRSRIRYVAVSDLSQRIRASTDPAQIGAHLDGSTARERSLREITSGGYRFGWLEVRYSDDGLVAAHQEAYRIGLGLAIAGILISALLGWMVGHLLTHRLSRLAAVADAVSGGDFTARARLSGRDEVARVGRAFDEMVQRIARNVEAIRLDRDRLSLPTECMNEGFAVWDENDRLVQCNRRFEAFLGSSGAAIELGMNYDAFLAGPFRKSVADNQETWDERIARIRRQHRSAVIEEPEFGLRDGRWLRVSKSHLPDRSVLALYTDITETKTRELALRDSEQRLRSIMDSVAEGIVVLDASGRVQVANPSAAAIFGYQPDELTDRPVAELLQAVDGISTPTYRRETEGRHRDGQGFPAEVTVGVLSAATGTRIVTIRDVTAQKADRDRMLLQATHDALTGLPNRRLFDDRLEMTLRRAARTGELVAVVFLDIDRFKAINDSLGHGLGDRLLQVLSARFQASLRDSDTVARMGGDEFIFILPGLQRQEDATGPAQKLLEAMREPVWLDGHELYVTASIGIAVFPAHGEDRDLLLRHADAALYRAKARGRNRFEPFEPELAAQTAARVELDRDLRRALARGELALVYQPQVNLRTGRIVGVEALMRWHHPHLGLVPPSRFIPIAEESGLISALGTWALRDACLAMQVWDSSGRGPQRVALNVSLRQLQHDDLAHIVSCVLAETGLAAGRLELELTEAALLHEDERLAEGLARLRALGVGLALDDFGTGYSSLSRLRQHPIQRLKLDRSFVRGIMSNRSDTAVAQAIIDLARELALTVVAEGVETAEQMAVLRGLGCEEGQGFLIGRPLPAREVASMLREAA
jgi:diguanylate cyclase (GGDEF)-like protein/PAS domain S-box-containing protein